VAARIYGPPPQRGMQGQLARSPVWLRGFRGKQAWHASCVVRGARGLGGELDHVPVNFDSSVACW